MSSTSSALPHAHELKAASPSMAIMRALIGNYSYMALVQVLGYLDPLWFAVRLFKQTPPSPCEYFTARRGGGATLVALQGIRIGRKCLRPFQAYLEVQKIIQGTLEVLVANRMYAHPAWPRQWQVEGMAPEPSSIASAGVEICLLGSFGLTSKVPKIVPPNANIQGQGAT